MLVSSICPDFSTTSPAPSTSLLNHNGSNDLSHEREQTSSTRAAQCLSSSPSPSSTSSSVDSSPPPPSPATTNSNDMNDTSTTHQVETLPITTTPNKDSGRKRKRSNDGVCGDDAEAVGAFLCDKANASLDDAYHIEVDILFTYGVGDEGSDQKGESPPLPFGVTGKVFCRPKSTASPPLKSSPSRESGEDTEASATITKSSAMSSSLPADASPISSSSSRFHQDHEVLRLYGGKAKVKTADCLALLEASQIRHFNRIERIYLRQSPSSTSRSGPQLVGATTASSPFTARAIDSTQSLDEKENSLTATPPTPQDVCVLPPLPLKLIASVRGPRQDHASEGDAVLPAASSLLSIRTDQRTNSGSGNTEDVMMHTPHHSSPSENEKHTQQQEDLPQSLISSSSPSALLRKSSIISAARLTKQQLLDRDVEAMLSFPEQTGKAESGDGREEDEVDADGVKQAGAGNDDGGNSDAEFATAPPSESADSTISRMTPLIEEIDISEDSFGPFISLHLEADPPSILSPPSSDNTTTDKPQVVVKEEARVRLPHMPNSPQVGANGLPEQTLPITIPSLTAPALPKTTPLSEGGGAASTSCQQQHPSHQHLLSHASQVKSDVSSTMKENMACGRGKEEKQLLQHQNRDPELVAEESPTPLPVPPHTSFTSTAPVPLTSTSGCPNLIVASSHPVRQYLTPRPSSPPILPAMSPSPSGLDLMSYPALSTTSMPQRRCQTLGNWRTKIAQVKQLRETWHLNVADICRKAGWSQTRYSDATKYTKLAEECITNARLPADERQQLLEMFQNDDTGIAAFKRKVDMLVEKAKVQRTLKRYRAAEARRQKQQRMAAQRVAAMQQNEAAQNECEQQQQTQRMPPQQQQSLPSRSVLQSQDLVATSPNTSNQEDAIMGIAGTQMSQLGETAAMSPATHWGPVPHTQSGVPAGMNPAILAQHHLSSATASHGSPAALFTPPVDAFSYSSLIAAGSPPVPGYPSHQPHHGPPPHHHSHAYFQAGPVQPQIPCGGVQQYSQNGNRQMLQYLR